MRVLVIAPELPPLGTPQAVQIGRLLYGLGAELTIVTATADALRLPPPNMDCRPIDVRQLFIPFGGSRRGAPSGWGGRLERRLRPGRFACPDSGIDWARQVGRALRSSQGFDVLVSFGEPMSAHLAALDIKKESGTPWVAAFSDPWSGSIYRSKAPSVRRRNAELEAEVLTTADGHMFTADEARILAREVAVTDRPHFVYGHSFGDWIHESEGGVPSVHNLRIDHIGSLYGARSLVRPARRMREAEASLGAPQATLRSIGGVGPRERLLAKVLRGSRVHWHGAVDADASLLMARRAGVLLAVDAPQASGHYFPSKLVDYAAAGPLIWHLGPDGPGRRFVQTLGGISSGLDRDEVAAGLAAVITRVQWLGDTGDEWRDLDFLAGFSAEARQSRFMDFLKTVANL